MRYRLIETDDVAGVLGGRLTWRGAEKLRRQHPPLCMFGIYPLHRAEVKYAGGWSWERWIVVCYRNRIEGL